MQQGGDEAMACPGLDRARQDKKERPSSRETRPQAPNWNNPGRSKQQEPPPPRLDHARRSGGLAPQTGSSGAGRLSAEEIAPTGRAEVGPVIRVIHTRRRCW